MENVMLISHNYIYFMVEYTPRRNRKENLSMFRSYAVLSNNYPHLHKINIMIVTLISIVSSYQLIENEKLIYAAGLAVSLACLVVFSRASEYKRRFLK